jgi:hypothetical protein
MKVYLDKALKGQHNIHQRMLDMRLAFETIEGPFQEIILEDGREKYVGAEASNKHLDEIAGELHSWYYCHC